MPERKSVRVTIYNQPYTLGVSGDEAEVEALAHSVDELMIGIAQRAGNVDGSRVAVMACLHLADQLRAMEREFALLKSSVGEKSREFSSILDRALNAAALDNLLQEPDPSTGPPAGSSDARLASAE